MSRAWRISPSDVLTIDLPVVMGIVNVTPDSFFDGGRHASPGAASGKASRMVAEGAAVIDVGGESTRPGAERVSPEQQIERVVPAILAIRDVVDGTPISIDTTSASVAEAAIDAGATIINDVSAGTEDDGMFALATARGVGLVLMHRLRPPGEDQFSDRYDEPPVYGDVVEAVGSFLASRAEVAIAAGVRRDAIVIDPGLGFGKSVEDNLALIQRTDELVALGFPVLSGISRKSFVGAVVGAGRSGAGPESRLPGSLGLAVLHAIRGARIFRVHDVRPHLEALDVLGAALRLGG